MKLTDHELRLIYKYLSREWIPMEELELRALISKLGNYLEIVEHEIRDDVINDK